MGESSKSESSKPYDEDETEVQESRYSASRPNKPATRVNNKSSGVSSDDETTSSSLLPVPETLRQMRGELKRIIGDVAVEPSDADTSSYCASHDAVEKIIPNSLEELRRKYSLKNEASVAMKMNSANLMLDDILNNSSSNNINNNNNIISHNNNNINASNNNCSSDSDKVEPSECYQSNYFRNCDFSFKKVQESDSSSLPESASTVKHCEHTSLTPVIAHYVPPVSCDLTHHHYATHQTCHPPRSSAVCTCPPPVKNDQPPVEKTLEDKKRKLSFFEKIQNLHLKYRIQSMYKIVQKSNPFNRDHSNSREFLPETTYGGNPGPENSNGGRICTDQTCYVNEFPRRMVFDLVDSSDVSQSEGEANVDRTRGSYPPPDVACTCSVGNSCTCPELIQCSTCRALRHTCPLESSTAGQCPLEHRQTDQTLPDVESVKKMNELVQTDSPRPLLESIKVDVSGFKKPDRTAIPMANASVNTEGRTVGKNVFRMGRGRCCYTQRSYLERTDIYYFDHGNSAYYRTTDNHPVTYTENIVDQTDKYATKFWGEIFGVLEIGLAFLISFILQLYRFLFTSIIRSLTIGLLQIFSDYFFKPLLTILFNGIIQPFLILAYNIATSMRDLCLPISQTFGFFTKEVANLFRSCRLVDVNHSHYNHSLPSCQCGNKV